MKKTKFAAILSLGMVPALFWSSESQAIPSWARKYNVSCYMCHSGFPQRNAVGEAFQANGFRFAGATEEALTKQKNIKIGNDEWKKQSPNAPFTGSFPQFDPLSMTLGGNLINYTAPQTNRTTGASTGKVFNWSAPNTVSLFYGGSLGDNITFFGQLSGFGATAGTVTSNAKAVLMLSPGFNFSMGSNFSSVGWNGSGAGGVVNVSNLLPSPTNYAELQFTRGETGGYSIVGGASVGGAPGAAAASTINEVNDMVYLRAKAKLIGAGMLSGANGTLGNSYNGLDNQVTVGLGLSSAKKNIFTGNYAGETFVYGGDVQGVYNNALVGVAASRDQDLNLTNVRGDAGYFVYPWLFAKVSYSNIAATANARSGLNLRQPTITPSVVAWIAPNVSVTATYTTFTKGWKESAATVVPFALANNLSNQNTFRLAFSAGF